MHETSKYTEKEAIRLLMKKADVRVYGTRVVTIIGSRELGNGTWGKIDYLRNYCRFTHQFVTKF